MGTVRVESNYGGHPEFEMPRYFFHMREGDDFIEDLEGIDLPDAASVHDEAIQAAREIMADRIRSGQVLDAQEFLIFDENGKQISQFPFRAALHLE